MSSEADEADPYLGYTGRRDLGDLVIEELETLPDGSHRQWYGAYRWDSVRIALADDALSVAPYREVIGLGGRYGTPLVGMDPPEHRRHRAVLQSDFSRRGVERWRELVSSVIRGLLDELRASDRGDLLTRFCIPVPARILTVLFDVDPAYADLLEAQARVLTAIDLNVAVTTSDELQRVLLPVIRKRREDPGEDIVSTLATAQIGGRALTDLEVFSHLRLLAIAGTDTVSRATANLVYALLHHPQQFAAVREDVALAPAAVDEAVRWECPALSVPRLAARATSVGDVDVPAGAAVRCCIGAANRDPGRWPQPDRFDIFRDERPHAGFGLGIHSCLGVHLAQLIMTETVLALCDLFPNLRLDPGSPPSRIVGQHIRVPEHLESRWL